MLLLRISHPSLNTAQKPCEKEINIHNRREVGEEGRGGEITLVIGSKQQSQQKWCGSLGVRVFAATRKQHRGVPTSEKLLADLKFNIN
jgi:hypothetical protein